MFLCYWACAISKSDKFKNSLQTRPAHREEGRETLRHSGTVIPHICAHIYIPMPSYTSIATDAKDAKTIATYNISKPNIQSSTSWSSRDPLGRISLTTIDKRLYYATHLLKCTLNITYSICVIYHMCVVFLVRMIAQQSVSTCSASGSY